MSEATAHLGVLTIELYIPASNSLKFKRRILKSLKDRIRSQFNVSVAEIDELDKWQKSGIGICAIGNDKSAIDRTLQHALSFMDGVKDLEVVDYHLNFS